MSTVDKCKYTIEQLNILIPQNSFTAHTMRQIAPAEMARETAEQEEMRDAAKLLEVCLLHVPCWSHFDNNHICGCCWSKYA